MNAKSNCITPPPTTYCLKSQHLDLGRIQCHQLPFTLFRSCKLSVQHVDTCIQGYPNINQVTNLSGT